MASQNAATQQTSAMNPSGGAPGTTSLSAPSTVNSSESARRIVNLAFHVQLFLGCACGAVGWASLWVGIAPAAFAVAASVLMLPRSHAMDAVVRSRFIFAPLRAIRLVNHMQSAVLLASCATLVTSVYTLTSLHDVRSTHLLYHFRCWAAGLSGAMILVAIVTKVFLPRMMGLFLAAAMRNIVPARSGGNAGSKHSGSDDDEEAGVGLGVGSASPSPSLAESVRSLNGLAYCSLPKHRSRAGSSTGKNALSFLPQVSHPPPGHRGGQSASTNGAASVGNLSMSFDEREDMPVLSAPASIHASDASLSPTAVPLHPLAGREVPPRRHATPHGNMVVVNSSPLVNPAMSGRRRLHSQHSDAPSTESVAGAAASSGEMTNVEDLM